MPPAQRQGRGTDSGLQPASTDSPDDDELGDDESEDLRVSGLGALLQDRRRVTTAVLVFVAGVVGV